MKVHYDAAGTILRILDTPEWETRYPTPPTGTAGTLTFDEVSNTATVADMRASLDGYTCPAGVLKKNGVNVTIQPDSPERADRADFDSQVTAALNRLDQIVTQSGSGLTNAQRDAAIGDLARVCRRLVKMAVQFRSLQR